MSHESQETGPEPYGTRPRRSRTPLVLLAVAFGACMLVLLWLAIQYPAR